MKKVLIGLVVMAVAAVLAWLVIVPAGGKKTQDQPKVPVAVAPEAKPTGGAVITQEGDAVSFHAGKGPEGAATPTPPPGTIRPLNAAEIAQQAREARPINQHVYLVGSWWGRAAQLTRTSNPELGKETQEMSVYLRDIAKLSDDQIKVDEVLQKESALVEKLKAAGGTQEMKEICQYLTESIEVTRSGGDPNTVPKP